jgi:Restriction endonuclease NaeI
MNTLFSEAADDLELEVVTGRIQELAGPDPVETFGRAIRQSIDEVLDGPRTGRWGFEQLEKTEKTYVGTKLEIVVRTALDLEPGPRLDLEIEGVDLDVKWGMNSGWQIPREAVDQLCLCIGGRKGVSRFQAGVVRCIESNLNKGKNQDGKRTLSSAGKAAMRMLVVDAPIPSNFVADMDPRLRAEVMAEPSIQGRITRLFKELPYQSIPRGAVETVARTTGDPMRRVRADAGVEGVLGGMKILSASYGNKAVEALGRQKMEPDHFMSVPQDDLDALSSEARAKLPGKLRERLGLT